MSEYRHIDKGIGTKEAKEEFIARNKLATIDEEKILGQARNIEISKVTADTKRNFALYNFILSIHDFSKFANGPPIDGIRFFYTCMIHHLQLCIQDRAQALEALEKFETEMSAGRKIWFKEIKERKDPLTMAEYYLNQVAEAARKRAKIKMYTTELNKRIIT